MMVRIMRAQLNRSNIPVKRFCGFCGLRARKDQMLVEPLSYSSPSYVQVSHARTSRKIRRLGPRRDLRTNCLCSKIGEAGEPTHHRIAQSADTSRGIKQKGRTDGQQ